MARNSLTREEVLEAAASLVKQHGPAALTMRKLAAELGTAVTSIYWHVGNRESLLDALVERTVRDMGAILPRPPSGGTGAARTPADRILSVARTLRRELRERPHLIAMVHERGLTERMFLPAQQALVHEVHAAGLRGARAADAVRAIQFQIVGFLLVERNRERSPVQSPAESELWDPADAPDDPALARALARPADPERLFLLSVRALVGALLSPPSDPPPDPAPARTARGG
ncbi:MULTISPECIES: TetR/AcrR family transcriptional regulator [unclassified Streptomyces]|uniref:TetR/AcrR family transcriptional regulator n=1 Tax=unclassified Streptomyces TaxID=2593676 RepID=UPI00226D45F3|nr:MULTISPECIES: TetR/AcrR family transcriptional regulator [unclassified Streptomyces]MCY0917748.1 TetR family transcriptional regulator [Streptomyces sp. H27-G5]MCY0956203.1 TetR family transcriptional regulator [Streptomyces sp. H27-H5]